MAANKRKRLTMDELVVNAKKVLKGRLTEPKSITKFESALKKATKLKPHG
jgi:hypothetical protein